ncbi:hypothetical protein B0H14DRAFT_2618995 [Mycena olivaceomarginata]|nr:hypothetical protein B0H14DRAFT_2618995 [Mycena olivaceomarginata]
MRHIFRPLYFKKLHRRGRNLLRRHLRPVPAPYGLANSGRWGGWGTGPGWGDEPGWGEESEDHAPADLQSVALAVLHLSSPPLPSTALPGATPSPLSAAWREADPLQHSWTDRYTELAPGDIRAAWPPAPKWDGPRWHFPGDDSGGVLPYL